MEGVVDLVAVMDSLSTAGFEDASVAVLLDVQTALERVYRQIPAVQHRVMAAVKAQAGPADLGARTWRDALGIRLRLSEGEAGRRLSEGEVLAPRRGLTGEALQPVYPATSAAQARGEITGEH
ncbi:MAG: DUF222 domain-containing protein, partial [Mycolicibacterium cosmeticum]|nr:DUF222 domain-containing protein [Mycolicibacterium cosmeticum]